VTTFKRFQLDSQSKLLFLQEAKGTERMCIPDKFVQRVLEMAHDD
jgi:hypothetical protein